MTRIHAFFSSAGKKGVGLLLGTTCLMGLVACGSSPRIPGVPPQDYANPLLSAGRRTGAVTGSILFASEYNQRSTLFELDHLTFVTHLDGRFWIRNVPPGTHLLRVTLKGYEPLSVPVTVEPGRMVTLAPLRLVMAQGKVLGRLVDAKGRSAKGLVVKLAPFGVSTISDGDGIFQFIGVSSGNHVLTMDDPMYFFGNKRFKLATNERRNLGNIMVHRQILPQNRTVGLRE